MTAVELAQRYIHAWNERDFAAFGEIFGADISYLDPIVGPTPIPLPAMSDYVGQLIAAFPDLRFEVERIRDGGDFALFEWVMHGRNTGDSDAHPATGRSVALPGVDVLEIRDGRIHAIRAYFDRQAYTDALGLTNPATVDPPLAATA
ncbi:ester cyclase [Lysobacter sp. 5GHs7-4]|uniref:ester cyclase n=1 Tax=Lysobacter sp. 5GHs7-4 TaxID=2904253 RepID=UPI001E31E139|nr:nuclear transport factor 2 family protein [Lysobacter sp. 5GHs7-4]UHQ21851.1 ester cyclase [Lysobacter sp. 5GHs7-4]